MRSIGVDPGSNSFDIFGLDDESTFIDEIIPTAEIIENPDRLISILKQAEPFDILVAPSGFGIPLKHCKDIEPIDIFKMTLKHKGEGPSVGLQKVIEKICEQNWNAYFIPGVKQFLTVPAYRKMNKIDMGTADKVCACVACLWFLYQRGESFDSMNFVLLELGSWFSAAVAVVNGKIVHGIGGSDMQGFGSIGYLDAELAYLMQPFGKNAFYKNGMNKFIKKYYLEKIHFDPMMLDNQEIREYLDNYFERLDRDLVWLKRICGFQRSKRVNIFVSGRYSKNEYIMDRLSQKMGDEFIFSSIELYSSKCGNTAIGAALIGQGLLNGSTKNLIDHLELKNAREDIFSHLTVELK